MTRIDIIWYHPTLWICCCIDISIMEIRADLTADYEKYYDMAMLCINIMMMFMDWDWDMIKSESCRSMYNIYDGFDITFI